jgi:hypothetical protein
MRVPPDKAGFEENGFTGGQPGEMPGERAAVAEDMPLVIEHDAKTGEASDSSGTDAASADTPVTSGVRMGSSHRMVDMGGAGQGAVEPSRGFGGNALANPVTIRIYNRNGIYYDSMYYANIGFINRYEVSKEFADYLDKYIG